MIRIKDIAERANVSNGTVDRVLHNRGRVAEDVRQRVLKIAQQLNYKPNLLARALSSTKVFHIAVLAPDPAIDNYWQAPKDGIKKAEEELIQYGLKITQINFDPFDASSFSKAADKVEVSSFDGLLIAPVFYRQSLAYFNKWKRQGIPFVLFNTHIPDYEPLMYIGQDSYQSGFLAGKLLHYGYKDKATFMVVHVEEDVPNSSHLIHKEQGFVDYFTTQGLESVYNILRVNLQQKISQQLDLLFKDTPKIKGIFVTNSKAHVIAEYLQQRELRHVNLVGYDLIERNLGYLNNDYISFLINQNPKGQGYWGIKSLADHLIFNKKNNPIKYLPLDIITKENLHYYVEADL
ncbi:LacI family transcriptional regulator [Pontibacter ummariensis]|uniref:Transcriptional regulator, LacI family n=1 Tax=Pontibacter ummariensis TaxID=1610492 RepID=A0A239LUL8_9BACT|nr:substrate-binding domain-containing protein [Pontibacter ummariensis]PRY01034.1 LacI family transcriptional regulator [Pontibacter ummariensis]SNT34065.1 transcriptional regulator, LacI family [Pontibacter ummariensis]